MSLAQIDQAAIDTTLAECDQLGRQAFLTSLDDSRSASVCSARPL